MLGRLKVRRDAAAVAAAAALGQVNATGFQSRCGLEIIPELVFIYETGEGEKKSKKNK